MDDRELRAKVITVLGEVAPEVEADDVDPSADFRDEFDLDSMDILNLAIGLFQATGVEIPESDYGHIVTLAGAVTYLRARLP